MSTPRCGLLDDGRNKNVFADQSWSKKALSYYFNNFTPDLSQSKVRELTTKALKFWSDVTPLEFTEQSNSGDIVIA